MAVVTLLSEGGTQSSLLLGGSDGSLFLTRNGADSLQSGKVNIPVQVRTGAFDQGLPLNLKEYGNVLFDVDPGGATNALPITITPYINGEAASESAIAIMGSGRGQFPLSLQDIFAYNIEFDISWTVTDTIFPILYQFVILWRPEPVSVTHWEARETSHGLPGYQHIRDMNVCIRSAADVTLTCTFDGGLYTQTYTLSSTGGARKKIYVPFNSNKFKVVRYSFDSQQQFRLYIDESETRVKPWLTVMGYQIAKPFGGEASGANVALEGSLLGR